MNMTNHNHGAGGWYQCGVFVRGLPAQLMMRIKVTMNILVGCAHDYNDEADGDDDD